MLLKGGTDGSWAMRVVMVQWNAVAGDPQANLDKALALAKQVSGADIIVFPELWTTGYTAYLKGALSADLFERSLNVLSEVARQTRANVIAGTVPEPAGSGSYNTLFVFGRSGEVRGRYRKIHLFGPLGEKEVFQRGAAPGLVEIEGVLCGLMVCYDLRFPELARTLVLRGAQVIFVVAQWPLERSRHWRILLEARAVENQVFMIGVNSAGERDGVVFGGGSLVVGPWGDVLAEGGGAEGLFPVEIDIGEVNRVRARLPVLQDRIPEVYEL